MKNFDLFYKTMKKSTVNFAYYTDFGKIMNAITIYEKEFHDLNKILNSNNMKNDFINIYNGNDNLRYALPLLVAERADNKERIVPSVEGDFCLHTASAEEAWNFLEKTNLIKLLQNNLITNFKDYYIGIEVGMDTNGRKNRSGKIMAQHVYGALKKYELNLQCEVTLRQLINSYNISQDEIKEVFSNEKDNKRFDYAFEYKEHIYVVESSGYNKGGSKPQETARAYVELQKKINKSDKLRLVWVTDGGGWKTQKNVLQYAYENIKYVFNLYELQNYKLDELLEE